MVHLSGRLQVLVVEARGLPNLDFKVLNSADKSDPYCVVNAEGVNGSRRIGKTFTIDDCLNPKWNYTMVVDLSQDVTGLKFIVKDKDFLKPEIIGTCFLETLAFTSVTKCYKGLLPLTNSKGRNAGSIRVQIWYTGTEGTIEALPNVTEKWKIKADDVKTRFTDSGTRAFHRSHGNSEWLHGMLKIVIKKAINLPNLDISLLGSFKKKKDVSDPYVIIMMEDSREESWRVGTSTVIDDDLNPIWNEKFNVTVCHDVVAIKFIIKDRDIMTSEEIGSLSIMAKEVKAGKVDGEFDLNVKKKSRKKSKLALSIKFLSASELAVSLELPECVFPMREMGKVTLYQDAHCVKLPRKIPGHFGHASPYARAWLDVYHTVMGAREFIYVVGWSVNAKTSLLRWDNEDTRCIGDILIQKANEGVNVCVMVWNELTSTDINKEGAMGTSDEATAIFFKDTPVMVTLACRERQSNKIISGKEHFTNFCYSHHQKCILADGPIDGKLGRQVVAFVGGLDLTNGRFDTPDHHLFTTLESDHKFDFYNNICDSNVKYGPRQPWHDIHCRIEGPACLDLLRNFQERWQKQGSKKYRTRSSVDDDKFQYRVQLPSRWNVQVFRSINSDSVAFPSGTSLKGLFIKKERIYENSIHRAYVHHIRRSKKFVYIENQYFMGSSHAWNDCRDARIVNLIPLEIVIRIEEKIKAGERYTAYIIIPMFPEGKPNDKVIQEMLHWQFRTIEMMYGRIAEAIIDANITAHPQDYLMFFCLGKKEAGCSDAPSELNGHAAGAFKNRRLMIYVHSKMAIFDDEFIIVGSANINDRSMNGNRDTEIAIGAYQPEYMVRGGVLPDGDVAIFRKSLWAEHMGAKAPLEDDPSSLACANCVKNLAEEGLLSFLNTGDSPGERHLMIYPLEFSADGSVTTRTDCPTFPDSTAKVIGARSGYIPTYLTS